MLFIMTPVVRGRVYIAGTVGGQEKGGLERVMGWWMVVMRPMGRTMG